MATGVEAVLLHSESCRDNTELDCNVAGSETLGNKESNTQYLPIVRHQNMSLVLQEGSMYQANQENCFRLTLTQEEKSNQIHISMFWGLLYVRIIISPKYSDH